MSVRGELVVCPNGCSERIRPLGGGHVLPCATCRADMQSLPLTIGAGGGERFDVLDARAALSGAVDRQCDLVSASTRDVERARHQGRLEGFEEALAIVEALIDGLNRNPFAGGAARGAGSTTAGDPLRTSGAAPCRAS